MNRFLVTTTTTTTTRRCLVVVVARRRQCLVTIAAVATPLQGRAVSRSFSSFLPTTTVLDKQQGTSGSIVVLDQYKSDSNTNDDLPYDNDDNKKMKDDGRLLQKAKRSAQSSSRVGSQNSSLCFRLCNLFYCIICIFWFG